jgi:hypothetical protein
MVGDLDGHKVGTDEVLRITDLLVTCMTAKNIKHDFI